MFLTETLPICHGARLAWSSPEACIEELSMADIYQAWGGGVPAFPEEDGTPEGLAGHLSAVSTPEAARALSAASFTEIPCRPRAGLSLAPGQWCIWAPVGSDVWALVTT